MRRNAAQVLRGNALTLPLADATVDLIVTSPPYFSLRSYQDGGEHYAGQLGSEPTPTEFVDALLAATAEMVRVLKPSGSLWVNLGDKYAGSQPGNYRRDMQPLRDSPRAQTSHELTAEIERSSSDVEWGTTRPKSLMGELASWYGGVTGYTCICSGSHDDDPCKIHGIRRCTICHPSLPPTTPAVVLDPFGGTGTTALVARALGRHGISLDMSADYCRLATWRTTDEGELARALQVDKPAKQVDGQMTLLEGLL